MSIIVGHLLWTFPYFKNLFTLLCYYGGGTGALLMVNDMNDAETRALEVLEFLSRIEKCILYRYHTTYRKNNNLEKCAGMGLNGFHIK